MLGLTFPRVGDDRVGNADVNLEVHSLSVGGGELKARGPAPATPTMGGEGADEDRWTRGMTLNLRGGLRAKPSRRRGEKELLGGQHQRARGQQLTGRAQQLQAGSCTSPKNNGGPCVLELP